MARALISQMQPTALPGAGLAPASRPPAGTRQKAVNRAVNKAVNKAVNRAVNRAGSREPAGQ